MKKKTLSILLTLCMLFTLLPTVALAEGESTGVVAGTRDELVSAIAAVADGGTITLTAAITGDPININAYEKSFSIDKTASAFGYPALFGSYTTNTDYYYASGYGATGVTMTHAKTITGKVETYTRTPVEESTVAAYLEYKTPNASSSVYVYFDMAKAFAKINTSYPAIHLKKDVTEAVAVSITNVFTLYAHNHSFAGQITPKTNYKTIVANNNDGSYTVTIAFIALTVAQQGGETFNYGVSELSDAVAKANSLSEDVTVTQLGYITVSEPTVLDDNVTYVINSGKTLALKSDFTVNGTLTNDGTINLARGASMTVKTGTAGTLTAPNANYIAVNTISGENTTYRFAVDPENSEATLITNGGAPVAYGTFSEALTAAQSGDTIRFMRAITIASTVTIQGKTITLDMNGKTITSTAATAFKITNGKAILAGEGNVMVSGDAFLLTGNTTASTWESKKTPAELVVGNGVVIVSESNCCIFYYGNGAKADVYGSLESKGAYSAIQGNGTVNSSTNCGGTEVNIYPGAKVTHSGNKLAIYHPQSGVLNVTGGEISGGNGIEMRAGTLTVSGNAIITGTNVPTTIQPNGSGSTSDGVGIAIAQHTTRLPVSVNISDGTVNGFSAVYESDPQDGDPSNVSLLISGGSLNATSGGTVAIYSENYTGFISGGYFTSDPTTYLAEGKIAGTSDKAGYTFMVKTAEVAGVEVSVGETVTDPVPSDAPEELKSVTVATDPGDTGLKAAGGNEAAKVTESVKAEASTALTEAGIIIEETEVTVVVQPKLAVTPKSYDEETNQLTLDIKAVCDIIATTDPSDIKTEGETGVKNAVVTKSNQPMTVPTGTPVVIKVKIPAVMATETSPSSGTYNSLTIKHVKENGKVYYYEAAVTKVSEDYFATFTVTNGFSDFTLMAADTRTVLVGFDSGSGVTEEAVYSITDVGTALPTATKSGYTFTGWVFEGLDGVHTTLPDFWSATASLELASQTATAQFANIPIGTPSYTLSFETNGGSAIESVSKASGTTVDLANYKPTRTGYVFGGWYADKELTREVTSVALNASTTVYAKWVKPSAFTDVKDGAYYKDAVDWAVERGVTSGTTATTFSPNDNCTRAQALTFLWRAMGSPEPASTRNPFTDVKADDYYYKAVLWAVEKGITGGTSDTTFSPNKTCSRGEAVTFLWRAAGKPTQTAANPFTDVQSGAYYESAVLWAVAQKITEGTTAATFSPNDSCTRAQVVTFLYRQFK